jgi:hypothetical protein
LDRRRVHERFERRLAVVLHHPGGEVEAVTRNVSLGGLSVVTAEVVPFGANVELEVNLPALGKPARLPATVRWCAGGEVGLQFGSLRAKEVWAINQLIRAAQE